MWGSWDGVVRGGRCPPGAGVPVFLRPAKHASPAAEVAAAAAHQEAVGQELDRQAKTASPVRQDRPRRAHFSFCGREGDVCYSRLSANVEDTYEIFVSACLIAANDHRLLGVELDEALKQVGQLSRR